MASGVERPTLAILPVEVLEHVYSERLSAIEHGGGSLVFTLRLTCRTIHQKLQDTFYNTAFGSVMVENSLSSLDRLVAISRMPAAAFRVTSVAFWDQEETGLFQYRKWKKELRLDTLTDQERDRISRKMQKADEDYPHRRFVDNSGLDAIKLTQAFASMPRLQDFSVSPTWGYFYQSAPDPRRLASSQTTTHLFWTLLMSLSSAGIRPRSLIVLQPNPRDYLAVDVPALAVPKHMGQCLDRLKRLDLALQWSKFSRYDGLPTHEERAHSWTLYLTSFLQCTPALESLTLRLKNHFRAEPAEKMFREIASTIKLPRLRELTLNGFECPSSEVLVFLQGHQNLIALNLENVNVIGDATYADILRRIADGSRLERFSSWQIAQHGMRTQFKSLGNVYTRGGEEVAEDGNISDLLIVHGPEVQTAQVEAWENMSERILELAKDLEITDVPSWLNEFERATGEWGSKRAESIPSRYRNR